MAESVSRLTPITFDRIVAGITQQNETLEVGPRIAPMNPVGDI